MYATYQIVESHTGKIFQHKNVSFGTQKYQKNLRGHAENFLQGQLSNDIMAIKDDSYQFSSYSTNQGKVISLSRIIKIKNSFLLLLTADISEYFVSKLSMYILMSKVQIKILDKVSSKNSELEIEIGKEKKFKNLLIKALKCKNSEFDDNPEITAYLQVKDISDKSNDEVFVFNGWTFSSSPSIKPFDHPVYDIWLIKCY